MSWTADHIFIKPTPEIITYLKEIEGFKNELFLVTDLEGIRYQWIIDNFANIGKHSIPKEGLLVLKPDIYRTGYDKEDDEFWNSYYNNNIVAEEEEEEEQDYDKWKFINKLTLSETKTIIDITSSQKKLLSYLEFLHAKFNTPIFYYTCQMWGGDIEEEYGFVFSDEIKTYGYDEDNNIYYELIKNEKTTIDTTVLQVGLEAVGLDLSTWFFALHEGSFEWKRYHIQ